MISSSWLRILATPDRVPFPLDWGWKRWWRGLWLASGAVLSLAPALAQDVSPSPAAAQRVTIGYVEVAGDTRYEPITGYGRLVLKSRERPFAGAQVGLDEAQALTRVLKTDFALERITVASPAEVAPAVVQARDSRGIHFFIVDAPAEAFKPLADSVRGRDVLIFNPTAADDALRRDVCSAQFVHTLPSLAMAMDGLVQYLVSRKWSNLLVFEGPLPADAVMAKAFENSAKKFGARIVARQQFKPGTDPREREKNDPALLSAINRDYDVVFVADHAFEFARQVPYHTVRARPVVGSIDLEADGLALDLGAQRRAAGELALPEAYGGPPHGGGGLGRVDRGQDGAAGNLAHTFDGFRQAAQIHLRRRDFRRQQGARRQCAAVGSPVAPSRSLGGAVFRRRARAGGGLSPQDQRSRHPR